jgi:hypothetical protein
MFNRAARVSSYLELAFPLLLLEQVEGYLYAKFISFVLLGLGDEGA